MMIVKTNAGIIALAILAILVVGLGGIGVYLRTRIFKKQECSAMLCIHVRYITPMVRLM